MFDATGAKVGNEFLVNTATTSTQWASSITGLSDGGFVVAWQSEGGDGSGIAVKAQVFDAAGAKVGSEFLVNTATTNDQAAPAIVGLSSGGFIVTWTDSSTWSGQGIDGDSVLVKAQVFDASGAKVGGEFLVNTTTANEQLDFSIVGLSVRPKTF